MLDVLTIKLCLLSKPGTPEVACSDEFVCERCKDNTNFGKVQIFTPDQIIEGRRLAVGRFARCFTAFAFLTPSLFLGGGGGRGRSPQDHTVSD